MFGLGNKDKEEIKELEHNVPADVFRGPGLYVRDMAKIEKEFHELKELIKGNAGRTTDDKDNLIKMMVDGLLQLNTELKINFSNLRELIEQQNSSKQAIKLDKLATTETVKNLENSLTLRFQAIQSIVEESANEIRQTITAGGHQLHSTSAVNSNKMSKTSGAGANYTPDPNSYLEKIKKEYTGNLSVMGRKFSLNLTKRETHWWEIKRTNSANLKRNRLLTAFFSLTHSRQNDLEVLKEIQQILSKYLTPSDKSYDENTICLILTFGQTEHLNINYKELVKSGIGFFPVESFTYLVALWHRDEETFKNLIINHRAKDPAESADSLPVSTAETEEDKKIAGDSVNSQITEDKSNASQAMIPDEIAEQTVKVENDPQISNLKAENSSVDSANEVSEVQKQGSEITEITDPAVNVEKADSDENYRYDAEE